MSHWTPFYWGDYLRDTAHLDLMEHGAYVKLLAHYYSTGRPLPANAEQMHRICTAFAPAERDAVDRVLSEFFHLEEDGYHNSRADRELAKRDKVSAARRKAAEARHHGKPAGKRPAGGDGGPSGSGKGPAPGEQVESKSNANAMQMQSKCNANGDAKDMHPTTTSTTTSTSTSTTKEPPQTPQGGRRPASDYPEDFERLWEARPRRAGNDPKPKAYKAWKARIREGQITAEEAHAKVLAYRKFCEATGKVGTETVMQLATFFGPTNEAYRQDWTPPRPPGPAGQPSSYQGLTGKDYGTTRAGILGDD